ncbi:DNA gyrase inhibitor YacG [Kordiimonas pumila]|uniref:DNA gyrase inhibitor YacG n=1 Tax=Kordiimonas pumila TaxID=2161677 RepID=A0ABV7D106_9PROT|nr:DNA gyrase inhibitor YacG [Kordiimonas pumila]
MPQPKCPECSKPTEQAYRPFCSKRCADLDLGRWFNEDYVLAGDNEVSDPILENSIRADKED